MRLAWTMGLAAAQIVALTATFFAPGFGVPTWSHLASLGLVLLLSGLAWRPLTRSRRILAIGALAASVLAIVSGFYLLYWKEGIRIDGYQDWAVWWHVAWSWAAAVFFFQHTWINRVQFVHFWRRTFQAVGPATLHLGAYALLLAAFAITWTFGKGWFDGGNYIALSFAAWLTCAVPAYILWMVRALRSRPMSWGWRRAIDLGLVPASALATLSGLPLVFFDAWLDAAGLKYASKFWHVWPSVLFAVLVFAHSVQVWSAVRRHWQALGANKRPQ